MLFSGSDYKVSEVDARKSISVNGGIVFVFRHSSRFPFKN